MRRGKLVWRRPRAAGADLSAPPLQLYFDKEVQKFRAAENTVARNIRTFLNQSAALNPNRKHGDETKRRVLELAQKHRRLGRGLASFIGRRLNVAPTRVRQILAETRT